MSQLSSQFRQVNTLQISVALQAISAELNGIDRDLRNPKNNIIKMSLLARKQHLKQMQEALIAQQNMGRQTVNKNEDKAFLAAAILVYIYLARKSAEQSRRRAEELRQARLKNNAPKLAV